MTDTWFASIRINDPYWRIDGVFATGIHIDTPVRTNTVTARISGGQGVRAMGLSNNRFRATVGGQRMRAY